MRLRTILLVSIFSLSLSATALAQSNSDTSSPRSSAHAHTLKDIVRLSDGSFVIGTIVEKVADERVIIETASGELRTIEMASVSYAGPRDAEAQEERVERSDNEAVTASEPRESDASDDDAQRADTADAGSDAPTESESTEGSIEVTGNLEKLTLHRRVGVGTVSGWAHTSNGMAVMRGSVRAYEPICTAPCSLELDPNTYSFGAAIDGKDPIAVEGLTTITGDTKRVHIDYSDRSLVRRIGWLSIGAGVGLGLIMVGLSTAVDSGDPGTRQWDDAMKKRDAYFTAGLVSAAVGGGLGLILTLQGDKVTVGVR